jgi:hypothetical protein
MAIINKVQVKGSEGATRYVSIKYVVVVLQLQRGDRMCNLLN